MQLFVILVQWNELTYAFQRSEMSNEKRQIHITSDGHWSVSIVIRPRKKSIVDSERDSKCTFARF